MLYNDTGNNYLQGQICRASFAPVEDLISVLIYMVLRLLSLLVFVLACFSLLLQFITADDLTSWNNIMIKLTI